MRMPNEHYVSKPFDTREEAEAYAADYRERNWGYCPRTEVRRNEQSMLYYVHIEQWHSCD